MWNYTCTPRCIQLIQTPPRHYLQSNSLQQPPPSTFKYIPKSSANEDYHWNELWRSLLGLLKFLLAKSDDLSDSPGMTDLINNLIDLLAMSLASGDTFLPGTTDYDDLFYKLVQATTPLEQFSQTCMPHQITNLDFGKRPSPAMMTLLSVCK